MSSRLEYQRHAASLYNALLAFEKQAAQIELEKSLVDLVKMRASQINGCLFCLDMHSKEAKVHGERELRLYHLPLWRESSLFTEREKAALEWSELLTRLDGQGIEDEDYERLSAHFSEKELAELTFVIASINAWNRLGVAFRSSPGKLDKVMGLDKAGLA
jgi:AhpD family alkylhydroperoxidase